MAEKCTTPYECHLFVCTNDRHGERKSCNDGNSSQLREVLKAEVTKRGWKGRVRVSASGCMGQCDHGPNVMLYPHKIWFKACSTGDADAILSMVGDILDKKA